MHERHSGSHAQACLHQIELAHELSARCATERARSHETEDLTPLGFERDRPQFAFNVRSLFR
jgi:hypothetical protein